LPAGLIPLSPDSVLQALEYRLDSVLSGMARFTAHWTALLDDR
jgi:hypothetical protein